MKRFDFLLISLALAAALCAWIFTRALPRETAGEALITQDGGTIALLPLNRDESLTITGEAGQINVVEISDGGVLMRSANCPDQLCVRQGRLTRAGQVIVCLPGRVVVTLRGLPEGTASEGPDHPDLDIIAG